MRNDWEAVYHRELEPPLPKARSKKKRQELMEEDVFGILNGDAPIEEKHLIGWSFVHPRDAKHSSR